MLFMYPARKADRTPHVSEQVADEIVSLGPKGFSAWSWTVRAHSPAMSNFFHRCLVDQPRRDHWTTAGPVHDPGLNDGQNTGGVTMVRDVRSACSIAHPKSHASVFACAWGSPEWSMPRFCGQSSEEKPRVRAFIPRCCQSSTISISRIISHHFTARSRGRCFRNLAQGHQRYAPARNRP